MYIYIYFEIGYELSKLEYKIGSPERPLSDLGLVGYRSYWQVVLLDTFINNKGHTFTLLELSALTSIRQEDILSTLVYMGLLKWFHNENQVGYMQKIIFSFIFLFRIPEDIVESLYKKVKLYRTINPSCITWSPPEK